MAASRAEDSTQARAAEGALRNQLVAKLSKVERCTEGSEICRMRFATGAGKSVCPPVKTRPLMAASRLSPLGRAVAQSTLLSEDCACMSV